METSSSELERLHDLACDILGLPWSEGDGKRIDLYVNNMRIWAADIDLSESNTQTQLRQLANQLSKPLLVVRCSACDEEQHQQCQCFPLMMFTQVQSEKEGKEKHFSN